MALRTDIQMLRGLAVLLVLFHHAHMGVPKAGYLGVDIFFVISGFLITSMIRDGIEQNKFSFAEFYFRRAKRLLPAAYVTFSVVSLLSFFVLEPNQFKDFTEQLIGAVTFTGNMVLLDQTGYFDGEATLKPLLHVWSLSIEEQYYLLLPVMLYFLHRRFWLAGVSLVLIFSFILCMVYVQSNPAAAFYLLPTRAWELAVGSFAALIPCNGKKHFQCVLGWLFLPAILALLLIPFLPFDGTAPGLNAFIICIATAVIILRRFNFNARQLVFLGLAKVGDFSYSLYLIHWPIFALINNAYVDKPPMKIHMLAVVISLCMGYMLYRSVEMPFKNATIKFSRQSIGLIILASLLLIYVPVHIQEIRSTVVDYDEVRRINNGFDVSCEFKNNFSPKEQCRNSDQPDLLVWGDSFAMHLVPGIIVSTDVGVAQATRSVCAPFIDMALMYNGKYNRSWAEKCLMFNQSVINYLAETPSIKTVVLSSPFFRFLTKGTTNLILRDNQGELEVVDSTVNGAVEGMRRTVVKLRELGKHVVIVAPPPSKAGFDMGRCQERKARGLLTLGATSDCSIPVAEYHKKQAHVLDFLHKVEDEFVPVVYFDSILCSEISCVTSLNGIFVYRDDGHFSYDGSREIGKKMQLGELLISVAK